MYAAFNSLHWWAHSLSRRVASLKWLDPTYVMFLTGWFQLVRRCLLHWWRRKDYSASALYNAVEGIHLKKAGLSHSRTGPSFTKANFLRMMQEKRGIENSIINNSLLFYLCKCQRFEFYIKDWLGSIFNKHYFHRVTSTSW